MTPFVRNYQAEDYPELMKLWEATGMGGQQRGDTQEVITRTINNGGEMLVLEDNEAGIIGSSWLTSDHRRIYLHHFCIAPNFQGKGLSHLLMEKSMAFVLKTGLQAKLEVHEKNTVAKSLYKKYGFRYLGDYEVHIIRDLNSIN